MSWYDRQEERLREVQNKYKRQGAYHFALFEIKDDPYRLHVLDVLDKVKKYLPFGGNILDFGCGEGLVTSRLLKCGYGVVGCDIEKEAVDLGLQRNLPLKNVSIDFFKGQKFDAVMALDVLEHVDNLKETMESMALLTSMMFIAVPDRPDPHAVRDKVNIRMDGWARVHQDTRHCRHFYVMKRG